MADHYDKQGQLLDDVFAWAKLMDDSAYKRVGLDEVVCPVSLRDVEVSTVWLGLDHSFGVGPPLIFETMVFGGALDGEQERYSTLEQAQAGHVAMVKRVTEATAEPDHG